LISDATAMQLSGGTFATGGHNETLGALTLASSSIIDFGAGSSILHFDDSAATVWTSGSSLVIENWSSGSDHLFFGDALSALTAGQVSQIFFLRPDGQNAVYGAIILS